MWFKNARLYTADFSDLKDIFKNETEVEDAVESAPFRPCQANEISTVGFAPLFGGETAFAFETSGARFFRLVEETKLLPAAVIREQLNELVAKREAELKREIRKNEKEALKTALTNQLLARAFATRREMLVYANPEHGTVAVSASSAKRAEKAIAMLRQAFTTFPARVLQPRCAVEDRMTAWISKNELPDRFTLGTDVVLKSTEEEGGVIRASKEDLSSDEIAVHIEAGKVTTELQLTYQDSLSFVLTSDIALKRMKPTDQYLERNLPEKSDDRTADLQAHLVLQGALLGELSEYLLTLFDCER